MHVMKKYLSLLIIVMLFGLMFIPSVFAHNKVEIKSIDLVEKSENTTINSEPKFNNLVMDFDIAFKAQDDYVKYKVVVSNNTNVDYKISEDTSFNESQYMTYKYDVENELKANDKTIVYVTITYSKTIDSSKLTNGKYSESNQAIVHLLNKNGEVVNPNTASTISMILINLFIVLFVSILLFIKFRGNKTIPLVLILGLFLIPITTKAMETLKLTINVNVEIEKGYEVAYFVYDSVFLTDDELKNWIVSDGACDYTLNIVDGSNTKKYNYCSRGIYIDSKLYSVSDKVNLKTIKIRDFDLSEYDSDTGVPKHCSEDSNDSNILNCDSNIKEQFNDISYWFYTKTYSDRYPFFETDKEVMNFNKIKNDYWHLGYLGIESSASFTMPDHNVAFVSSVAD